MMEEPIWFDKRKNEILRDLLKRHCDFNTGLDLSNNEAHILANSFCTGHDTAIVIWTKTACQMFHQKGFLARNVRKLEFWNLMKIQNTIIDYFVKNTRSVKIAL